MNFGQGCQSSLAAYSRIMEIKDIPPGLNGTEIIDSIDSVSVEGISYGWGKTDIIKNFTQLFVRGKIYCIMGKNGAGKYLICSQSERN